MKSDFVPRVNQLDAIQLDTDILRIIREKLINSAQHIAPGLVGRFNLEIDFLLRAIIWRHSIGHHSATFGQRALFISYDTDQLHSGHTLHKHFVLNVFVKYISDNIAFRWTDNRWLQRMLSYGENTVAVCTLLNFFRFLKVGKRPGLTDYVLGLDNISLYGNRRRDISYSHMTRELIWAGFMELLGFTLPLVNYHLVKRKCRNFMHLLVSPGAMTMAEKQPNVLFTAQTKCAYCNERPTIPHHMGCDHVFCYYCLKGNVLVDAHFECPECQHTCDAIKAL